MDALKIGSLIEHGKWAVRRISIDKNSMHSQAKLKCKEESDIDDWEIETSLLLVYIFTLPTILFLVSMVAKREIAIVKRGHLQKARVPIWMDLRLNLFDSFPLRNFRSLKFSDRRVKRDINSKLTIREMFVTIKKKNIIFFGIIKRRYD